MALSEQRQQTNINSDQSLKLAVTLALLKSKLLNKPPSTDHPSSNSDAQKWKRKAKERKIEIIKLKEELKEAEDGLQHDLFPESASCKCYFYDHLGKLSPRQSGDGLDQRFNDALRRRFLRQVHLKERRRKRSSSLSQGLHFSGVDNSIEEETEHLKASVDFLVELCETAQFVRTTHLRVEISDTVQYQKDTKFANWSHQAVDFILAALKNLLSAGKRMEHVEGIVSNLITLLCRRMCPKLQGDEVHQLDADAQLHVQHLLRKLGSESCIGQRVLLAVSERLSVLTEKLFSIDPFDEAFPDMHNCMYILIQLIEFLVSDYLRTWSNAEGFDTSVFEEWLTSILNARKRLELFASRNTLYTLYMDRVVGLVAKQVSQIPLLQKLNPDILESLFH